MRHRVLGRTGVRVSELGLGGHEYRRWLPRERDMEEFLKTQPQRNKIMERALDAGVNFLDTTHPEEAESLGLALKSLGRRREACISAMIIYPFRKMGERSKVRWRDVILKGVEERLKALHTDYIDIFNIHMPEDNYSRDKLEVTLKFLEELKDQDKIGWIGASSHKLGFLAELMRKYDCFDSVMVRYNYHLQKAREVIFPLTRALEVGVVVMKPFTWPYYGVPYMRFGPVEKEESHYAPSKLSLRWILSSPEVATVVASVNSAAELEENLDTIKEEEVAEEVLGLYLKSAQSPKAEERLRKMLSDPAIDIRNYAKKALEGL